jgi:hypothetical protein
VRIHAHPCFPEFLFMLKPALLASALLLTVMPAKPPSTSSSEAPAYTAKGNLVMPANYREWIFLTSGVDMSYSQTKDPDHHVFDNVFVNPSSYRAFLASGIWPDKTTFILEIRGADSPISINKRGHTQSAEATGHEIHVKDNGKWSFYDLPDNSSEATLIPPPAACYTCHEQHGAVGTTFVQFYPTLLPIATSKHTLSP